MNLAGRVRFAGLLAVALVVSAMAVLAFGHTQADTSLAGGDGTLAVDCDAAGPADPDTGDRPADPNPGVQADCFHAPGSTFHVDIAVTALPAGGIFGFQTKLRWTEGAVNYAESADPGDDALWPDCDIPARSNNYPPEPSVFSGCVPLPALTTGSTYMGAVFVYEFSCKADPVPLSPPPGEGPLSELTLIPAAGDPQGGTIFLDANANPIIPNLVGAIVTCEAPPTEPTPTQGPDGPTPTPPLEEGVNITAEDGTVAAGGSTTLTITVLDASLNPVADAACTVSVSDQPGTTASVSPTSVTTDVNGEAEVTLNVGSTVGTVEVTADCGDNGSQVLAVEVVVAGLPPTGVGAADGGMNAGLWAIIGLVLAAAAAGLALSGWRSVRTRA